MRTPFLGPAYRSRSLNLDQQSAVNLFLEVAENRQGKQKAMLLMAPGLDPLTTLLPGTVGTSPQPSPPPPPAPPVVQLWCTITSCEFAAFLLTDNGNVAPQIFVSGSNTTMNGAVPTAPLTYQLAFDSASNQNVFNFAWADVGETTAVYSIPIFAKGVTGNIAPLRNIVGSNTGFSALGNTPAVGGGICLDDSGNIYAGALKTVWRFPPGSDGNATSTVLFTDSTLLDISTLFFDSPRQLIWLSNFVDIRAYDLNGTLKRKLTNGALFNAMQVYIGPDESIFVADQQRTLPKPNSPVVYVFPPTADADTAPSRTINVNVQSAEVNSCAVDSAGITYMGFIDDNGDIGPVGKSHIQSFAANANGTPTALTDITGAATLIDSVGHIQSLAVH